MSLFASIPTDSKSNGTTSAKAEPIDRKPLKEAFEKLQKKIRGAYETYKVSRLFSHWSDQAQKAGEDKMSQREQDTLVLIRAALKHPNAANGLCKRIDDLSRTVADDVLQELRGFVLSLPEEDYKAAHEAMTRLVQSADTHGVWKTFVFGLDSEKYQNSKGEVNPLAEAMKAVKEDLSKFKEQAKKAAEAEVKKMKDDMLKEMRADLAKMATDLKAQATAKV